MRVTDVKTYVMRIRMPNDTPGLWTFVKVETDEGVHGWGEASKHPPDVGAMTAVAIRQLKGLVVGEDAEAVEAVWHKLYRHFSPLGNRGLATAFISGIDIALWDIRGRLTGKPVFRLLGGPVRPFVPLYANGWFVGCSEPEEFAESALRTVEQGYRSLKTDPFMEGFRADPVLSVAGSISPEAERKGLDIIGAVRRAVGSDVHVLVDAHGYYNVATAIRIGQGLAEHSVDWYEEPVPPDSYDALEQVRRAVSVPICVGERLFTRYEFVPVFQRGLADYVMPDVIWTGGITELKKISSMAQAYHVLVSPHNAFGPLQVLAGAHTMMTVPNFYRLEFSVNAIPNHNRVIDPPLDIRQGNLHLPDRPGLGVELDEELLDAETRRVLG